MHEKERFYSAYKEIVSMLEDSIPLSIKRSVYVAEWAYLDGNLDYEKDFCLPLSEGKRYMQRLIAANNWDKKYKTAKQIALCTFFFQPLSGNNNTIFTYDFSNEYPDGDWHNQLVSRTLKKSQGTMPFTTLGIQVVRRRTWSKCIYSSCSKTLLYHVQR